MVYRFRMVSLLRKTWWQSMWTWWC